MHTLLLCMHFRSDPKNWSKAELCSGHTDFGSFRAIISRYFTGIARASGLVHPSLYGNKTTWADAASAQDM
jgi:hypothetical protein